MGREGCDVDAWVCLNTGDKVRLSTVLQSCTFRTRTCPPFPVSTIQAQVPDLQIEGPRFAEFRWRWLVQVP